MKKMAKIKYWLLLTPALIAPQILAQVRPIVTAVRTTEPINIDGVLTEAIWHTAPVVTELVQRDPSEGAPASEKSAIRVAYDAEALYVGADLYDTHPDSIVARLDRRDTDPDADAFAIFIDPYYDRRSGFIFGVSAGGTLYDGILYNDNWNDFSWDGVWEGKAHLNQQGWSAEIRIPFSQLRFKRQTQYLWAVNFVRLIERRKEESYLVIQPKNAAGFVSRFADLVGISDIEAKRRIELLPYTRAKAEYLQTDTDDPFNDGSRYLGGLGADVKIGIGNNLTFDGTINPDFGQVEVDPAVINLSDVETFYDEKRPFFIEGARIFEFGRGGSNNQINVNFWNPQFLYSRRIGTSPQGSLPDDYDYVSTPDGTRILSAGKLTGKVGSNWSIGALSALTAREHARLQTGERRFEREVEPVTSYNVFRALKEFNAGDQGLGFITTHTQRFFRAPRLEDEFNRNASVGCLDGWFFLDKDKTWVLGGWGGFSRVSGNRARILDLQQSSRHYLQRPDAKHLQLDSNATSLTGMAGRLYLNKQKGNVFFNAALGAIDPRFDLNDLGFMQYGDVINGHIILGYQWTKPSRFKRYADIWCGPARNYDFGGNSFMNIWLAGSNLNLVNYQNIHMELVAVQQTLSTRQTRGGPLMISPSGYNANIYLESDQRKKLIGEIGLGYYGNHQGDRQAEYSLELEWKPSNTILFSFSPSLGIEHNDAQWVGAYDDAQAVATYGKHYVFAEMDQKTLSASVRLNWTFTPQLTLQMYAQPLVASGDYYRYKELARPKSYDFIVYGQDQSTIDPASMTVDPDGPAGSCQPFTIDNPDFTVKSLRLNAVLRWEFRPGSTLYLVWSQGKYEDEANGQFRWQDSLGDIARADADNILMLKVSYWIN